MKILCTADWHLGKKLEGYSRMEEQSSVLEEICLWAEQEKPQAVLIAGDCFDTSSPPPECSRLFVQTLARLSQGGECPVLVIAGNHDSPSFLSSTEAFASQLGVMILGRPNEIPLLNNASSQWKVTASGEGMIEIAFARAEKPVRFLLAPYSNAQRLKKDLGSEDKGLKAWELLRSQWEKNINPEAVNILAAHHFFTPEKKEGGDLFHESGPVEDEGERPVGGVGGANAISLNDFPQGLDYAVFGHIHRPQGLHSAKTKAFYTGSPLIYSLSESGQDKSLLLIEIGKKTRERRLPLQRRSDVRRLIVNSTEGLEEKLSSLKDHYLEIIWTGGRYLESSERRLIEQNHPRILRLLTVREGTSGAPLPEQVQSQSIESLFAEYFASKTGGEVPESLKALLMDIVQQAPEPEIPRKQGFLPISLTLEGVYSYEKKTEIDFTCLGLSGLFGIFGAVGSGKSSIIEAMIFALYEKTHRLDSSKGKLFANAYNMMNHNSSRLLIEFVFQVRGEQGDEDYKIVFQAKRMKTEADIKKERIVYQKSKGEWVPLTEKSSDKKGEGEQILGLSYEDFCQTIVLQQRDFMGFLNSSGSENAKTLQRLFRLDRFDLFEPASRLKAAFTEECNRLSAHLEALASATPEEQERLTAQWETLKQELLPLEKELAEARGEMSRLEQEKERQKARQDCKIELRRAEAELLQAQRELDEGLPLLAQEKRELALIEAEGLKLKARLTELDQLLEKDPSLSKQRLGDRLDRIAKVKGTAARLPVLGAELQRLGEERSRLRALAPLAEAVSLLKEGEACPLCGSGHHPAPYTKGQEDAEGTEALWMQVQKDHAAAEADARLLSEALGGESEEALGKSFARLCAEVNIFEKAKKERAELFRKREGKLEEYTAKKEKITRLQESMRASEKNAEKSREAKIRWEEKWKNLPPALGEGLSLRGEELEQIIAQKEAVQKQLLDRQGQCKKALEDCRNHLEKKQKLERDKAQKEVRLNDAAALANLFKGAGFVRFVGWKYMERLCASANGRFSRFTGGRFLFQAPEKAEHKISLIDCHNGGARRDLSTLSGGQSFQAALALSAALADQSGAGHRFFFIDEGFGSLDAPNLQAVLDTLSALAQEEGRLIGLISHVDSLKEEIAAAFFITLGKEGSSLEMRIP